MDTIGCAISNKVKRRAGNCKIDNGNSDEDKVKISLSKSNEPSKMKEEALPTCQVILIRCDEMTTPGGSFGTVEDYGNNSRNAGSISGKNYKEASGITNRKIPGTDSKSFFPKKQNLHSPILSQVRIKQHVCQSCSKSFGRVDHLEWHMRIHTGERPHQCQLCSKSFAQLGNLNQHIRSHTGERLHQCHLCSKSFQTLQNLNRHIILLHTSERPYQCNICSKSFGTPGNLELHIRTHTGERPHQCHLCLKSFGQSGSLKRHIRVHGTGNK